MKKIEKRPWGHYAILATVDGVVIKKLSILPEQQLSYQSHAKRHEHWTFVKGSGHVTLDDQRIPVQAGVVVSVPLGAKHRITNTHTT